MELKIIACAIALLLVVIEGLHHSAPTPTIQINNQTKTVPAKSVKSEKLKKMNHVKHVAHIVHHVHELIK